MRYQDVASRLRLSPRAEVGSGASSERIECAERELAVRLPESYKAFLREFGWGGLGHWEVYGLGSGAPFHLELVHETVSERTEFMPRLPLPLIPLMNDGGGNHYCLDTSVLSEGECPVVFWDHDLGEAQTPHRVAPDFTAWLSEMLDQVGA